jgi:ABC-2 type transport system permease protein
VSYDHTAFWTHVAAPIEGRVDRTGRAVAGLLVGTVVVLVVALVALAVTARWDAAAPVLGVSLGVLTTALGTSSVYSARVVYPVPKPGESPFTTPQGTSFAVMVSQWVGMLVLGALCLPGVGLGVAGIVTGHPLPTVLAAVVGPAVGVVVLVAGIRIGARIYDRRAPELLQTIRSFA